MDEKQIEALAIADLQGRLRIIAEADGHLPQVAVDGIYGEETAAAVRAFQQRMGIAPTGAVDLATWQSIEAAYIKAVKALAPPHGIEPLRPGAEEIKVGDSGAAVQMLLIMLSDISERFVNIPKTDKNGLYDEQDEKAVKIIQSLAGIEPTGAVDSQTWTVITRLFNLFFERAWQ